MKKSMVGALLSGLVFPGLGQFYLGKRGIGLAFIISTNVGIAGLVFAIAQRIPPILEKLQPVLEKGNLDFNQLMELSVRYAGMGSGSILEKISLTIMIGSWCLAIGHALYTGQGIDKSKGNDL